MVAIEDLIEDLVEDLIEDLEVSNMSRSAKGTVEKPALTSINAAKNILASGHGVLAYGAGSLEPVTKQEPLRNREKVAA